MYSLLMRQWSVTLEAITDNRGCVIVPETKATIAADYFIQACTKVSKVGLWPRVKRIEECKSRESCASGSASENN